MCIRDRVQFKLYQGELLQYKPGASDHRCDRMDLALVQIDLYQELGESTQSETPESALQSERGQSQRGLNFREESVLHFDSNAAE